jgi:hypothetical protein
VRCQPGGSACGTGNSAGGDDYTGELQATYDLRITDRLNYPDGTTAATVSDTSFPVTVRCSQTPSNKSTGGTCAVTSSANSVVPGAVVSGERAIWGIGQVKVFDGGLDGLVSTPDNLLFETQSVFVP